MKKMMTKVGNVITCHHVPTTVNNSFGFSNNSHLATSIKRAKSLEKQLKTHRHFNSMIDTYNIDQGMNELTNLIKLKLINRK